MDCQEFEAELERRLDERLDPDAPELRAHSNECVPCRDLFRESAVLLKGVAAWQRETPVASPDLTSRIVDVVLNSNSPAAVPHRTTNHVAVVTGRDRHDSAGNRWAAGLIALTSVAGLWMMFFGSNFQAVDRSDRRLTALVHSNIAAPDIVEVTDIGPAPQADLETVLVSAEGAYSQLATKTMEAAQDFALLWPASTASATEPPAMPPSPGSTWGRGWSTDFAPISDSVGEAFDFLKRAAPRVENSST